VADYNEAMTYSANSLCLVPRGSAKLMLGDLKVSSFLLQPDY